MCHVEAQRGRVARAIRAKDMARRQEYVFARCVLTEPSFVNSFGKLCPEIKTALIAANDPQTRPGELLQNVRGRFADSLAKPP